MADNINITEGSGKVIATDDVGGVQYQRVKIAHGVDGSATDTSGSAPLPVVAGGYMVSVSASKTRPADTTAYASGDVLNESTSAGTGWTFTSCARSSGGSGIITRAMVLDSANQTTKPALELWLFTTAPGSDNDNTAFTPTDAELENLVGIIPLVVSYVGDATSGAGGNCILSSESLNLPFVTSGSADLFGVLVVRGAYTPVSEEAFRITLTVSQD